MSRSTIIMAAGLNISANPHPDGVYIDAMKRASEVIVNARGSDYATISAPEQVKDDENFYLGRILLWTEIDQLGRWLDIAKLEDLTPEQKKAITIPANAKPNFRPFDYVFEVKSHKFLYETRNEFGQTLGPTTARRIMGGLLSRELLGADSPDIAVSILPKEGTVERIFALPELRYLFIRVERPNPDTTSSEKILKVDEYLRRIQAQRVEQEYVKARDADSLHLTEDIRDFAEVGAQNGFVRAVGHSDGKREEISTSKSPKVVSLDNGSASDFFSKVRSLITSF